MRISVVPLAFALLLSAPEVSSLAIQAPGNELRQQDPQNAQDTVSASDVAAVRQISAFDIADVTVPVAFEVGVEGECVRGLRARNLFGQVRDQISRLNIRLVGKRIYLARLLDHKQTIAPRCIGDVQALIEF